METFVNELFDVISLESSEFFLPENYKDSYPLANVALHGKQKVELLIMGNFFPEPAFVENKIAIPSYLCKKLGLLDSKIRVHIYEDIPSKPTLAYISVDRENNITGVEEVSFHGN